MNIRKLVITSATFITFTLSAVASTQADMAACLSAPMVDFDGTVVDAALATPELSTLVDALVAADLVDALNDAEDITVYAPVNSAFDAIPDEIIEYISADTTILSAFLLYHVTPGINDPRRYQTAVRRDTLLGQTVFYQRRAGEARVNQATFDCQGVKTSNGVVWLLNAALIPQYSE